MKTKSLFIFITVILFIIIWGYGSNGNCASSYNTNGAEIAQAFRAGFTTGVSSAVADMQKPITLIDKKEITIYAFWLIFSFFIIFFKDNFAKKYYQYRNNLYNVFGFYLFQALFWGYIGGLAINMFFISFYFLFEFNSLYLFIKYITFSFINCLFLFFFYKNRSTFPELAAATTNE